MSAVQHHIKKHRLKDGYLPRIRDCARCQTAKQKCWDKMDFKSRAAADRKALEINIERDWQPGECVKPYRCRYCTIWHVATAHRKDDVERVEKMRRKWLRSRRQKDDGRSLKVERYEFYLEISDDIDWDEAS